MLMRVMIKGYGKVMKIWMRLKVILMMKIWVGSLCGYGRGGVRPLMMMMIMIMIMAVVAAGAVADIMFRWSDD
jgi:hypothetical protein